MALLLLLACAPDAPPTALPLRTDAPGVETIPGVADTAATADTGETGAIDTAPTWVPGPHLPVLLVDAEGPIRDDRKTVATLTAIAAMREETAEAEARDHAMWPVLGAYVEPNWYQGATWDEEIVWFQAWVLDRAAWMDLHVGE